MILLYDCEQFILRTIENCAPHVGKIYVSYSPYPWNAYNKDARKNYANKTNPDIIKESVFIDKIELLKGEWDTEEEQREHCRLKAIEDGFDYLIIQDADEFYLPNCYTNNIKGIIANPNFEVYQTPWIIFWKSTSYVVLNKEHLGTPNTIYSTCPLFAINLHLPVKFESRRVPLSAKSVYRLEGICYHLSWVFSDSDVLSKISTWGHSHQVNKNWYKWKWLGWKPETKYINPMHSIAWTKAIKFEGELPKELLTFENPKQQIVELNKIETFLMKLNDLKQQLELIAKRIYRLK